MADRSLKTAGEDSTSARPHHRVAWSAGAGLLVVGLVALLLACVLWIPSWLYPALTSTDVQNVSDAAKAQELKDARLQLQNDARTTLLQGLGVVLVLIGAGIGASVTLRQVRATRDQIMETAIASRDQLKLSEQGQFTDRYTRAVDQLDEEKALAIRLGGLYALERIAQDSPRDRATIAEILCAYVRTAPDPPVLTSGDDVSPVEGTAPAARPDTESLAEEFQAELAQTLAARAPDVQAAVTILARWQERLGEPPPIIDLHGANLQRADLSKAHLQGAILEGAQLQGARLSAAQLQGAPPFRRAAAGGLPFWRAAARHSPRLHRTTGRDGIRVDLLA